MSVLWLGHAMNIHVSASLSRHDESKILNPRPLSYSSAWSGGARIPRTFGILSRAGLMARKHLTTSMVSTRETRVSDTPASFESLNAHLGVQGSGLRVEGLEFGVWGWGLGMKSLGGWGLGVGGLVFWDLGLSFF